MKFILVSDVHATSKTPVSRKDDILKTFIEKFTFVLDCAREYNASILQAGDFFHSAREWLILESFIILLKKYKDIKIYSIFGQHDMYMRSKVATNMLSIFNKAGFIELLNENPFRLKCSSSKKYIYLYGCNWEGKVPEPKGDLNILVIHAPISKREVFPGHAYTSPKYFIKKNKGWDLILVGDTHRYFIEKTRNTLLVNTGPLLRLEANEYNMIHKPKIFIYDSFLKTITNKIIIPHKQSQKILSKRISAHDKNMKLILKEFADELKKNINSSGIKDGLDSLNVSSEKNTFNSFSFIENLKAFMINRKYINRNIESILRQTMEGKSEN